MVVGVVGLKPGGGKVIVPQRANPSKLALELLDKHDNLGISIIKKN